VKPALLFGILLFGSLAECDCDWNTVHIVTPTPSPGDFCFDDWDWDPCPSCPGYPGTHELGAAPAPFNPGPGWALESIVFTAGSSPWYQQPLELKVCSHNLADWTALCSNLGPPQVPVSVDTVCVPLVFPDEDILTWDSCTGSIYWEQRWLGPNYRLVHIVEPDPASDEVWRGSIHADIIDDTGFTQLYNLCVDSWGSDTVDFTIENPVANWL